MHAVSATVLAGQVGRTTLWMKSNDVKESRLKFHT